MPRLITLLLLCVCTSMNLMGEVRLPSVIGSNMVLQQNATVRLWGWSAPREKIRIHLPWSNTVDTVVAGADAKWMLPVKTPAAGGPYTITIQASNLIRLENVLVGEVWLCSGQSNMEWSANSGLKDAKAELPVSADHQLRFFHIPRMASEYPQDNCDAKWVACDSVTLKSFSAVGYFFGKNLRKNLNVPIGLINASWGGTAAELWTPTPLILNDPELKAASDKLGKEGTWQNIPGRLYNAMIAPIIQYTIAGTIWYQGESNTNTNYSYTKLFSTMIESWRKAWNNEFPFYFVQIAPYKYGDNLKGALLREAQVNTLKLPRTGMAVISDLVEDTTNIHPQNKHDVGLRLANLALGDVYGKTGLAYRSPLYDRMEKKDGKIIVYFKHAEGGLKLHGKKAAAFYIAGQDRQFVPADVKVDGGRIIVSAKGVKDPEAVRFAFTNTAIGNLFSSAGLPVSPFRTDTWPAQ